MDYTAFDSMEENPWKGPEQEPEQAYMERVLKQALRPAAEKKNINDYLELLFVSCSAKDHSVTLEVYADDWKLNPSGNLHGGMISTVIDVATGLLTRYYRATHKCATAQLSVNFLRPVPGGSHLRVTASADKVGRRLVFLRAEASVVETGKLAATATANYV